MGAELQLTTLERSVLSLIVETCSSHGEAIARQLANARISDRRHSGVGFFLGFETEGPPIDPPNFELGDVHAELVGLEEAVGFILFVRDGRISWLEGFTYAGEWPAKEVIRRVYFERVRRVGEH